MLIRFFAPGLPKGQPRPRAFARRMGSKVVARVFDAGTAEGWKSAVVAAGEPYRPAHPVEVPVRVSLRFAMPRPKSMHTRAKAAMTEVPHTGKPDADNLAKAVLDAMTLAGWWRDDSQVYVLTVQKYVGNVGERTGCHVVVEAQA